MLACVQAYYQVYFTALYTSNGSLSPDMRWGLLQLHGKLIVCKTTLSCFLPTFVHASALPRARQAASLHAGRSRVQPGPYAWAIKGEWVCFRKLGGLVEMGSRQSASCLCQLVTPAWLCKSFTKAPRAPPALPPLWICWTRWMPCMAGIMQKGCSKHSCHSL